MKDMTVETLNFIILCMGLLFVMAGILLIVGKLAGKRLASIAFGVLMIAWGLLCGIPELRSWMLARATDWNTHWRPCGRGSMATAGCLSTSSHCAHGRNRHNGGRPSMTSIDGLFAILEDRGLMPAVGIVLALGRSRASLPELWEPQGAEPPPPTGRGCQAFHAQ